MAPGRPGHKENYKNVTGLLEEDGHVNSDASEGNQVPSILGMRGFELVEIKDGKIASWDVPNPVTGRVFCRYSCQRVKVIISGVWAAPPRTFAQNGIEVYRPRDHNGY